MAIGLWTVFAIDFSVGGTMDRLGKVKGTDFLHFYVIGSLARDGHWRELYDPAPQYQRAQAIAPASSEVVFVPVESPQLAVLFAPMTAWGYTTALAIWLTIGVLLYAACCVSMWRAAPALHPFPAVFFAACAAFPGFFSAVLHGQTAWLSLACVTAAMVALRSGRNFAAGLALGLLVFKPALGGRCRPALPLRRRMARGGGRGDVRDRAAGNRMGLRRIGGDATLCGGISQACTRIATLLEPRPGDSLRGYFQALALSPAFALGLFAASALAIVWTTVRIWRSEAPIDLRLASIVLALILINPHVNTYDLLLLAPVCVLTMNWYAGSRVGVGGELPGQLGEAGPAMMRLLVMLLFVSPLLAALPAVVRLQFSVGAMVALLLLVVYLLRRRIWFWIPWNAGATSAAVGA